MAKPSRPVVKFFGWSSLVLLVIGAACGLAAANWDRLNAGGRADFLTGSLNYDVNIGYVQAHQGQFVTVTRDFGDQWQVSFGGNVARISKSAVGLINRTKFNQPITATLNRPAIPFVANFSGSAVRDQPAWRPGQFPALPAGLGVQIIYQEGDNYIFSKAGGTALFKLPIAYFTTAAGQDFSGTNVTVASAPWIEPRKLQQYIIMGMIGCAALSFVFLISWCFTKWGMRPLKDQTVIDMSKWAFDQETREYYRITYVNKKEGMLVNKRSYDDRATERLKKLRERDNTIKAFAISSVFLIVCIIIYLISDAELSFSLGTKIFIGIWFIAIIVLPLGIAVQLVSIENTLNSDEYMLGPPPEPAPDPDEVMRQNAYGDARIANIAEIHHALSGSKPAQPQPAQPMRPAALYDE